MLALDQGGHASRAIVFDASGRNVASGSCDVAETRPAEDRVEQDPEDLVRSLRRAAKDAFKHLGKRDADVVSAGLATQRSSVVAWDKVTGAALTPVISWQDRRARDRITEFGEHASLVRAKTGLRLSPHYGASKLSWILANVPAATAALREGRLAFGPLSSFLAFRLLDEKPLIADPANASRTLLWNIATRCFDPELCDLFGVPIGALPTCVPTRALHGTLDVRGRKVPMNVITGDQSAAIFAGGEPDPQSAYVNFGTGAFVQRTFTDAVLDAPRLLRSVVFADAERTTLALEGTVNGAGSALHLSIEELGLRDEAPDLDAWMGTEANPPLYLNGVSGLGAPYWMADFPTRFVGEGTREARLVAVIESIVFLVESVLVEMATVLPKPARIRVSGGLSRLDGLCRRMANLSDIRVERADDPEATARGLAWLLHERAVFADRATVSFEPRADSALAARFAQFRAEIERAVST